MKKITTILILSLFVFGCSEENGTANLDGDASVIENSSHFVDVNSANEEQKIHLPENTQNEYDYVGKIHNQALTEILLNYDKEDLDIQEVLDDTESVLKSNSSYLELLQDNDYPNFTKSQVEDAMSDFSNDFENYINNLNISSQAKQKINDLVSTTINFNGTYDSYYKYVVSFEQDIEASNLGKTEKQAILSASSVARYSGHLWNSVIYDNPNNPNVPAGSKGGTWIKVGADVLGGVIGGFAAGATTVVGVGLGVIQGASAASGIAAIFVKSQQVYAAEITTYQHNFADNYVIKIN